MTSLTSRSNCKRLLLSQLNHMNLSDLKIALLEAKRQRKIASPHKGNQYVKWDNEVEKLQSQIDNYGILCRGCAAFHTCKLEKKGTALKCRNHWEHLNFK